MKTDCFARRSLLSLLAVLPLLAAGGCSTPSTRGPGPHNTFIVDTSPGGDGGCKHPSTIIDLPAADQYHPDHNGLYSVTKLDVPGEPITARGPGPHNNVVLIRLTPTTAAVATTAAKPVPPPQVFIHFGSTGLAGTDHFEKRKQPFVVVNVPENYRQGPPNGQPYEYPPKP